MAALSKELALEKRGQVLSVLITAAPALAELTLPLKFVGRNSGSAFRFKIPLARECRNEFLHKFSSRAAIRSSGEASCLSM